MARVKVRVRLRLRLRVRARVRVSLQHPLQHGRAELEQPPYPQHRDRAGGVAQHGAGPVGGGAQLVRAPRHLKVKELVHVRALDARGRRRLRGGAYLAEVVHAVLDGEQRARPERAQHVERASVDRRDERVDAQAGGALARHSGDQAADRLHQHDASGWRWRGRHVWGSALDAVLPLEALRRRLRILPLLHRQRTQRRSGADARHRAREPGSSVARSPDARVHHVAAGVVPFLEHGASSAKRPESDGRSQG